MSDLSSMLVPLVGRQLPGWPAAEAPSVVEGLVVILGIPLAVGAVIALLVLSGSLIRRGRGGNVQLKEPLWLGRTSAAREVAGQTARGSLTKGGHPLETSTGGASVHW